MAGSKISGDTEATSLTGGHFAGIQGGTNKRFPASLFGPDSFATRRSAVRIEQFGGKADWDGDTGTDNYPALMEILDLAEYSATGSDVYAVAPDVLFGVGGYYFSQTVELKRITRLLGIGSGSNNRGNGSNLFFAEDTTGVIVQQRNTEGATGGAVTATTSGEGSVFDGLSLWLGGTDKTKHGIQMRARAIIRNCSIYNTPGDGIHIRASSGSDEIEGNANSWYVENCLVSGFGRHGLYTNGQDANAGTCIRLETDGLAGDYGCGIYEGSGLGNNYFGLNLAGFGNQGVHHNGIRYLLIDPTIGIGAATEPGTDNNVWYEYQVGGEASNFFAWSALATYDLIKLPIFKFGNSNKSVFSGIYVEGACPSHITAPGMVIGGQCNLTRRSAHMRLSTGLSPIYVNTGIGARRDYIEGTPGHTANGTFVLASVGSSPGGTNEDGMNLLEHRRQIDGDFSWEWQYSGGETVYGFLNAKPVWRIGTPTTTEKMGRPLTPVAHTLTLHDFALRDPGNSNNWRIHGIRSAIPTAAGEYARGELRWNSAPAANGKVGWACTTGGALAPAWVSGTNYALGAYVKASNTKFYKCTVDGGTSSTNEPSHASGAVTEADGFEWTHVTDAEAVWKPFGAIDA